jgi:mxaJ protein
MKRKIGCLAVALMLPIVATWGGGAQGGEVKELRVCADPNNLPYSNQRLEGFENKIAELVAKELGATLSYYWWPHQRGLVRNTLGAERCDVLIGIPKGFDPVLSTKAYYRTGYVIAYRKDSGFRVGSLDDPVLKRIKIGVHRDTPPLQALAQRDIIGENVVRYSLFYDWVHPEEQLGKPIQDLIAGEIDVAMAWGPTVGYYIKKYSASFLEVVPLQDDGPYIPMVFDISMGVKRGNKMLKAQLEEVLRNKQAEIRTILEDYGVPLLASAPRVELPHAEDQPGQVIYHRFEREEPPTSPR